MTHRRSRYGRHSFPPDIISHAVWLYSRHCLSFRYVTDRLAARGVVVSYETVRQWCRKLGPAYARRLTRRQGLLGDTSFLDEVFVTINGPRQYLWRAVDQDGDVIDTILQSRLDGSAARRCLRSQRQATCRLVTDTLGSSRVAHRDRMPSVIHGTAPYANSRADASHQPTRPRARYMPGVRSPAYAQRVVPVDAVVQTMYRVGDTG
jgi:putative transposase